KDKEDEIIFHLESWGQLDTKEILTQACDEFIAKLDEFDKIVK
ncbi:hypothetical protein KY334_04915, partial [Candidatus Woesearchaeota archaeon]|nr:hypothetical protein [Candidatus Woesearchaeota archaeon]